MVVEILGLFCILYVTQLLFVNFLLVIGDIKSKRVYIDYLHPLYLFRYIIDKYKKLGD